MGEMVRQLQNSKRASMIILEVLLSLIVVVFLIIFFLRITENVVGIPDRDNRNRLEGMVTQIETLATESAFDVQKIPLRLSTKELFLFFSDGDGPIILESLFDNNNLFVDSTYFKRDSMMLASQRFFKDTYTDKNFKFERPSVSECMNQACICHCNAGELWKQTNEVPYITHTDLEPLSYTENGYFCKDVVCISAPDSQSIFTNSRGNALDENEFILIDDLLITEKDQPYIPVPLDILILSDSDIQLYVNEYEHDLFFKERSYAYQDNFEQTKRLLRPLLFGFRWEGGVVIGGSGSAITKADERNKRLQPVLTTLHISKINQTSVYGVCTFEKCLGPNQVNYILEETNYKQAIVEAKKRFNAFIQTVEEEYADCIIDVSQEQDLFQREILAEFCINEMLVPQLHSLFSFDYLNIGLSPAIQLVQYSKRHGEVLTEFRLLGNEMGAFDTQKNIGPQFILRKNILGVYQSEIPYPYMQQSNFGFSFPSIPSEDVVIRELPNNTIMAPLHIDPIQMGLFSEGKNTIMSFELLATVQSKPLQPSFITLLFIPIQ